MTPLSVLIALLIQLLDPERFLRLFDSATVLFIHSFVHSFLGYLCRHKVPSFRHIHLAFPAAACLRLLTSKGWRLSWPGDHQANSLNSVSVFHVSFSLVSRFSYFESQAPITPTTGRFLGKSGA